MTEYEKDAIKNFIDSLHPVSYSKEVQSWKERALHAEQQLLNIKNTLAVAKNVKPHFPMMQDAISQLVFRWNESENLRNQLTEIDLKLSEVKALIDSSPVKKINTLVHLYKSSESRNSELQKQLDKIKYYLRKTSNDMLDHSE